MSDRTFARQPRLQRRDFRCAGRVGARADAFKLQQAAADRRPSASRCCRRCWPAWSPERDGCSSIRRRTCIVRSAGCSLFQRTNSSPMRKPAMDGRAVMYAQPQHRQGCLGLVRSARAEAHRHGRPGTTSFVRAEILSVSRFALAGLERSYRVTSGTPCSARRRDTSFIAGCAELCRDGTTPVAGRGGMVLPTNGPIGSCRRSIGLLQLDGRHISGYKQRWSVGRKADLRTTCWPD